MKKLLFALMILVIVSGSVFAIDLLQYPPPVSGGDFIIDIGLGISSGYGLSGAKIQVPPIFASVEYALPVRLPISVGGIFSYWQYHKEDSRYPYVTIAARGNWHWAFNVNWLDFYTGLALGFMFNSSNYFPLSPGVHAGAHFYFTKNVGIATEFGFPVFAKVGLALKF
ncbi:MAG: hypothetical protein LBH57_09310 [Treponema sp.]|jgi:hypothetical protein|nr:hypothetical protein [Treponema sp.]